MPYSTVDQFMFRGFGFKDGTAHIAVEAGDTWFDALQTAADERNSL